MVFHSQEQFHCLLQALLTPPSTLIPVTMALVLPTRHHVYLVIRHLARTFAVSTCRRWEGG